MLITKSRPYVAVLGRAGRPSWPAGRGPSAIEIGAFFLKDDHPHRGFLPLTRKRTAARVPCRTRRRQRGATRSRAGPARCATRRGRLHPVWPAVEHRRRCGPASSSTPPRKSKQPLDRAREGADDNLIRSGSPRAAQRSGSTRTVISRGAPPPAITRETPEIDRQQLGRDTLLDEVEQAVAVLHPGDLDEHGTKRLTCGEVLGV